MRTMAPPRPPSPPLGPPQGSYFSRRKEMQPLPPSPAEAFMMHSSTNMPSTLPKSAFGSNRYLDPLPQVRRHVEVAAVKQVPVRSLKMAPALDLPEAELLLGRFSSIRRHGLRGLLLGRGRLRGLLRRGALAGRQRPPLPGAPRAHVARPQHGDLNTALHPLVDHRAHDDVGVAAKLVRDRAQDLVHPRERQVRAPREVHQKPARLPRKLG